MVFQYDFFFNPPGALYLAVPALLSKRSKRFCVTLLRGHLPREESGSARLQALEVQNENVPGNAPKNP